MYYRDLEAWRKSIELVKAIYLLTANFPKQYIKEIDDEMSLLKQVNALIIGLKNYIKNLST